MGMKASQRPSSPTSAILDPDDNRYPGGKSQSGLREWIIDRLPSHVYYSEPFCGKAGIFRAKPAALHSWLLDRDAEVVTWLHRQFERGSSAATAIVGNGIEWLETAEQRSWPEMLVYCDPPYLHSTRKRMGLYKFEMSERQHVRFLKAANRCECAVVISGYASDLYRNHLPGWKLDTIEVRTRGGTWATECLWRNAAAQLASSALSVEYSGLGTHFRERERVGRLVKRWTDDFKKRPERERHALLMALMDAERSASRKPRRDGMNIPRRK